LASKFQAKNGKKKGEGGKNFILIMKEKKSNPREKRYIQRKLDFPIVYNEVLAISPTPFSSLAVRIGSKV